MKLIKLDVKTENILKSFNRNPEHLIPILQKIQQTYGYLPEDILLQVAKYLNIPESKVFGVATFYAQFRFKPIGKNRIMVCRGTACHVKGAPNILEEIERTIGIKEGDTTEDGEYSLETVACIGCCSLAPCIMINNKVEAKMTPKKVKQLFKKAIKEGVKSD